MSLRKPTRFWRDYSKGNSKQVPGISARHAERLSKIHLVFNTYLSRKIKDLMEEQKQLWNSGSHYYGLNDPLNDRENRNCYEGFKMKSSWKWDREGGARSYPTWNGRNRCASAFACLLLVFHSFLSPPSLPHASLVMEFWSAAQLCVNNITAGRSPGPIRLVPVRRRQMAEAWLLGCSQLLRLSKQAQLINEEQKRPTSKSLLLGRAK